MTGFLGYEGLPGSVLALPAAALAMLLLPRRRLASHWPEVLTAGMCWLSLLVAPGPLNITLLWMALGGLALRSGTAGLPIHLGTVQSLWRAFVLSPFRMIADLVVIRQSRGDSCPRPTPLRPGHFILPVAALTVFSLLLASANPLLGRLATEVVLSRILSCMSWPAFLAGLVTLLLSFALFSARIAQAFPDAPAAPGAAWQTGAFSIAPLIFTLMLLNGLFLAANALDFHYIWQQQQLPAGFTHAAYVHRGAYTLMATAMLAGALVVVGLRPGAPAERSSAVRGLVYGFTLQNAFLVASSAQRTMDYIESYGLTEWRLAGLIWMALVAGGLLLIVLRIALSRSSRWLADRGVAFVFAVLTVCSFIDLAHLVADWNVARATRMAQAPVAGVPLDVDYLRSLGHSALPALIRWSQTKAGSQTASLAYIVPDLRTTLARQQQNWRHFTLRDAMIAREIETAAP
jgi:hypothetical protein